MYLSNACLLGVYIIYQNSPRLSTPLNDTEGNHLWENNVF